MDWNFLKARRQMTLQDLLQGVSTESDALQLFSRKGISNPPLEEIKQLFSMKQENVNVEFSTQDESLVENSSKEILLTSSTKKTKVVSGSTGN